MTHDDAMQLCKTIAHNMGRLSGIAEQLYRHATEGMETDVTVLRRNSVEVVRDMTGALDALLDLAEVSPEPRKPH
ncbi:hypothetical protein [Mesorhizobium sp. ISC11]|uniref:hypothetical protein n=1 Tax=Mesorhizobium sp. ISC11 TaxID=3076428 RepID=UPI00301CC7BF